MLKRGDCGSLLTLNTVPTVIPMCGFVQGLRGTVTWTPDGIELWVPSFGSISAEVREGRVIICPRDVSRLVASLESLERGVSEPEATLKALPGSTAVDVNGVSLRYLKQGEEEYGLLDGGATNALRQGTPLECRGSSQISVELG